MVISKLNVKTDDPNVKYYVNQNLNKILTWKNIEKDNTFIEALFKIIVLNK